MQPLPSDANSPGWLAHFFHAVFHVFSLYQGPPSQQTCYMCQTRKIFSPEVSSSAAKKQWALMEWREYLSVCTGPSRAPCMWWPLEFLCSVQFSCSVMSNSLWPHESQHTRPPCPSPTPGVHTDSRPLSQWCHPAISSSVILFSSYPQSLPASKSFPMSQPFAWGGQSTGVSAFASYLPKKSQGWSPSEWTGWISLQSKGLETQKTGEDSKVFSNTTVQKHHT